MDFMRPLIIPIFLPQKGCAHKCIFCNQELTSGLDPEEMDGESIRRKVMAYIQTSKGRSYSKRQIAFFGGTFTGLERSHQEWLLDICHEFIESGDVESVRISTRPDALNHETCRFLKLKGVSTVELGVESMIDEVLRISRRGHTSSDTVRAVSVLKEEGLEVVLHLMIGLPGDSPSGWEMTCQRTISLKPDMVRIHPTLVLRDTVLADLWYRGRYRPLGLEEAVDAVKRTYIKFLMAGISVIRIGLQPTPLLEREGSILAGPYHPAFRQIVESSLFHDMIHALLQNGVPESEEAVIRISPLDETALRGQGNENISALYRLYPGKKWTVVKDPDMKRFSLSLESKGKERSITVFDLY